MKPTIPRSCERVCREWTGSDVCSEAAKSKELHCTQDSKVKQKNEAAMARLMEIAVQAEAKTVAGRLFRRP